MNKPRRNWKKIALISCASFFLVLVIGIVIGLFFVEARGKAAWEAYRKQWEVQGERFDTWEHQQPEISPEENFAQAPIFNDVSSLEEALTLSELTGFDSREQLVLWLGAQPMQFASYFEGSSEQEALSKLEAFFSARQHVFDGLAEAARRPQASYLNTYEPGPYQALPAAVPASRSGSRMLFLRGMSRLRSEDIEGALQDAVTLLQIARHLDEGPTNAHALFSATVLRLGLHILWEGLRDHQWSVSQLNQFKPQLERIDYLRNLKRHVIAERSASLLALETCAQTGKFPEALQPRRERLYFPKGWVYRNMITFSDLTRAHLLPPDGHLSLQTARALDEALTKGFQDAHPHRILAMNALAFAPSLVYIAFQFQSHVDQARIAIALEEYRIENDRHPQELADLEADLPLDQTIGTPYHYYIKQDGSPLIYSYGANARDDQGTPNQAAHLGDWVWQYTYPAYDLETYFSATP